MVVKFGIKHPKKYDIYHFYKNIPFNISFKNYFLYSSRSGKVGLRFNYKLIESHFMTENY